MGEGLTTTLSTENPREKSNGCPNLIAEVLCNFTSFFSKNVGEYVKFHLKPSKNNDRFTSSNFTARNNKQTSTAEFSLERQMDAWKHDPEWVDRCPNIEVTIPKGSLSYLSLNVDVGLPPDAAYNILTDPENKRIFKNIKEVTSRKVLVDEGLRQIVEVEQAAIWKFLWWSGTISVHMVVDQNREDHSVKFKQIKSGFMENFEGSWKMEPLFVDEELCHPFKPKSIAEYVACTNDRGRIASKLRLEQLIQPTIVPPPPLSWYLRGITTKTTEMLMDDLLAETARIRQAYSGGNADPSGERPSEKIHQDYDACNIKERWATRRKRTRHSQRRLYP